MEAENQDLQYQVDFLRQRAAVLDKEKQMRQTELEQLRTGIQNFADAVRRSFEAAQPEIKAYIGGELCDRGTLDGNAGMLLIDRANRLTRATVLTGAKAFVRGPTSFCFCLLRPIPEDAQRVRVVAMSQELNADQPGVQEWNFFEPVAAENGE